MPAQLNMVFCCFRGRPLRCEIQEKVEVGITSTFFMAGAPKGIMSPEGDRRPAGAESAASPFYALLEGALAGFLGG